MFPVGYFGMNDEEATFSSVKKEILDFRNKRNWEQYHKPKNLSMAIGTEAGELMEHFLWDDNEEAIEKLNDSQRLEEVKEELGDILIFSFLMAECLGEDVSDIMLNKIKKNEGKYPVEKSKGKSKKYTELGD